MRELTHRINNFDYHFEMSDSSKTYNKGREELAQLHTELNALNSSERMELKSQLLVNDTLLTRYFGEFFQAQASEPKPTDSQRKPQASEPKPNYSENEPIKANAKPKKTYLSKVMRDAWELVRSGMCGDIKEGLKMAWSKYKLLKKMSSEKVVITYRSISGVVKTSVGTLKRPSVKYRFSSSVPKESASLIFFYDVKFSTWKTCNVDQIISFQ